MNSALDKAALRLLALSRRRAVTPHVRAQFAQRLAEMGPDLAATAGLPGAVVSAYRSVRDEAETMPLIEALARAGFATALPVTVARGAPLSFRLWRPGDPTVRGQLAIPEPSPDLPLCAPDVLFVPLAAFDRGGYRIGYGAGHYDRSLALLRTAKPIRAIGIGFATQ